ncbi:protein of unknown function [Agrobacterium pusense]|uniref:Uncharacterized protein n=1 Tax=Agrobacterium pusense TaxID=648995 RepID=U4Q189_9HYPH|nr:protein of unknown function [Agrobacterium pusense]
MDAVGRMVRHACARDQVNIKTLASPEWDERMSDE